MLKYEICVNDLKGEQRELAKIIGMEAYINLVGAYGGSSVYIAKDDRIKNLQRDSEIVQKFTGNNYYALAKEYGLSERAVRNIIKEQNNGLNEQLKF